MNYSTTTLQPNSTLPNSMHQHNTNPQHYKLRRHSTRVPSSQALERKYGKYHNVKDQRSEQLKLELEKKFNLGAGAG